MDSGKQETWLALRAQAGDREAFDRLFRLLQEPLYRYIFSLVGARAPGCASPNCFVRGHIGSRRAKRSNTSNANGDGRTRSKTKRS